MKIITFEEIDSTNEYIKRNIDTLKHLTFVHSYYQTHGKGRNGHVWDSDKGTNLLLSFLLKDFRDIKKVHQITQIIALAIIKVLKGYQIEAQIKWPNDIYVHGQKIAGILVETVFQEYLQAVIIGIGLNVNDMSYQSLQKILLQEIDILEVRQKVIDAVLQVYTFYQEQGYTSILKEVNMYSYLKDKKVKYQEHGLLCFKELLEDGRILVENEKKRQYTLHSNEITLHQGDTE